ncbi:MAG TPA: hypothetical protein VKT75_19420 [Acidobacteriaceae bacterium]|nr:hypothetical protein [Acidobacteriaceae bacterium]
MSLAMSLPELPRIYRQYSTLSRAARDRLAGSLAGKVLLSAGSDGLSATVAGTIAGAASLWVDADGETLRDGMRAGLCDFVVGTLDEALRILKNEVRQKRPVSVGLQADPAACVRRCIDRGFQPDVLLHSSSSIQREMETLTERGAVVLVEPPPLESDTSLLCWSVDGHAVKTMRAVGQIAAESLDSSRADTPDRLRWIETAPRDLGRTFAKMQCLEMDRHESASFVTRVRSEYPAVRLSLEEAGT